MSLAWNAPSQGCSPTSYRISAGSSPGLSNLGALSVERQTRLRLPAPPGTYYVRVAAVNASGASAASNEVAVTVAGGCAAPGPPDRFIAEVSGTTVSMRWQPPLTGGWPTGYLLEAGREPASSDLVTLPVGGLSFSAQAGRGVFFVRARAVNACGTSPASLTYPLLVGPPPSVRVTLTTSDGVGLAGAYYPPLANGPAPALLLLHEAFEDRRAWTIFAVTAQRRGYAVLVVDLRGHGESPGPPLPVSALSMHHDVDAGLAWLRARPEVNAARMGMAGASLGANLALQGGARHGDVRSLGLLSPGITLFLIRAFPALLDYGTRPLLMVAAEGDPFAAESVRQMAAAALGPVETRFYEGGFDGTQLLRAYPELNARLLEHFDRTIP
jgi:pimeloyl-ACP methyl ester carboxylesterase